MTFSGQTHILNPTGEGAEEAAGENDVEQSYGDQGGMGIRCSHQQQCDITSLKTRSDTMAS